MRGRCTLLPMAGSHDFQDHFSGVSASYAAFRPRYPAALFQWLASVTPKHELAWDCATGTGQAAAMLAQHFTHVVASDAAAAQIAKAQPVAGVQYAVFGAEQAELPDASVDLVTVAQALHWFDLERFYAQVQRVLVPGGVLAAWTYQLFRIEPNIDAVIEAWYRGPLDSYWPQARRHVEAGYQTLAFPFEVIEAPALEMEASWRLAEVLGYLGTWSAVARYRDATGDDPIALIREQLEDAWGGDVALPRRVVWSMPIRVGRTAAGPRQP